MNKSATEIMQEIIFSAVLETVVAVKDASKGMPNTLLRDINSMHNNTILTDLPPEAQRAIGESVRSAFNRLLKEGYVVAQDVPAIRRPSMITQQTRRKDSPKRSPTRRGE